MMRRLMFLCVLAVASPVWAACSYTYPDRGWCTYQPYAMVCDDGRWTFSAQKSNGVIATRRLVAGIPQDCWEKFALQWGCYVEKCQGLIASRCPGVPSRCWRWEK
jgi:hypothetical protein